MVGEAVAFDALAAHFGDYEAMFGEEEAFSGCVGDAVVSGMEKVGCFWGAADIDAFDEDAEGLVCGCVGDLEVDFGGGGFVAWAGVGVFWEGVALAVEDAELESVP